MHLLLQHLLSLLSLSVLAYCTTAFPLFGGYGFAGRGGFDSSSSLTTTTTTTTSKRQFLLFTTKSTTTNSNINSNSNAHKAKVCVVVENIFNSNSNNNEQLQLLLLEEVAKNVSTELGIEFINNNDCNCNTNVHYYTHAVTVVGQYGTSCGNKNCSDYAIGIKSLLNMIGSDENDGKKNYRRSKKKPKKKTRQIQMKPVIIDFSPSSSSHRNSKRSQSQSQQQQQPDLLLKAVQPWKFETIWDMTAGFGQDSLVLANANSANSNSKPSHVTMIEQNQIVACLIKDAMRRLHNEAYNCNDSDNGNAKDLYERLSFIEGDAVDAAMRILSRKNDDGDNDDDDDDCSSEQQLQHQRPDVVYLDPMFPPRKKKSAKVKKNMQILHGLLGSQEVDDNDDDDHSDDDNNDDDSSSSTSQSLFDIGYELAKRRVVVKRPINAPFLSSSETTPNNRKPSHQIMGSINRWDVYVK